MKVIRGKKLRGRKKWISNNLMEKENKIKWVIKTKTERKSRERLRVRVRYIKLWISGKL